MSAAAPPWRRAAFVGAFADALVGSTEVDGGDVGGLVRDTADALNELAAGSDARAAWAAGALTPRERAAVAAAARLVASAADAADALAGPTQPAPGAPTAAALAGVRAAVAGLGAGARALLPGGWRTRKTAHVLWHVLSRPPPESAAAGAAEPTLDWAVCNAGAGSVYHLPAGVPAATAAAAWPASRIAPALVLRGVPLSRASDEAFVAALYAPLVWRRDEAAGPSLLYEALLPHLARGTLSDAARGGPAGGGGDASSSPPPADGGAAAAGGGDAGADGAPRALASPQRAGANFYRSLLVAVRHVLSLDGFPPARLKLFSLALRAVHLARAAAALEHVRAPLDDSDARLLEEATRSLARVAVKAARADIIDSRMLAGAERAVAAVRAAVGAAAAGDAGLAPPLLAPEMSAPLIAMPGFDLLHEMRSTGEQRCRRATPMLAGRAGRGGRAARDEAGPRVCARRVLRGGGAGRGARAVRGPH